MHDARQSPQSSSESKQIKFYSCFSLSFHMTFKACILATPNQNKYIWFCFDSELIYLWRSNGIKHARRYYSKSKTKMDLTLPEHKNSQIGRKKG